MNAEKQDKMVELIKAWNIDGYQVMESGIHDDKKPPHLDDLNRTSSNNIHMQGSHKHKTPHGAGMVL